MTESKHSASNPSIQAPSEITTPLAEENPKKCDTVTPCFCCSTSYKSFYRFINILDLVLLTLAIIGSLSTMAVDSSSLSGSLLNVVWLVVAAIAYAQFNKNGDYGSGIHVCYGITRLVYSIILLVTFAIVFLVLIFVPSMVILSDKINWVAQVVFLCLLSGIYVGFSFYWSLLFLRVIKAKSAENENQKAPESPDVALTDEEDVEIHASNGV